MRKCFFIVFIVGLSVSQLSAQDQNHYVIIGAFGVKENATRLASRLSRGNLNARVELNTAKKLYYVYLMETADRPQVYAYLMKVRVETQYKDAWVFHGTLGDRPILASTVPKVEAKEEPKPVVVEEQPPVVVEPPVETAVAVAEPPTVIPDPVPAKPPGKAFFFKLVSEQTGNPIDGQIHVLESAKATEYIAYSSNEIVYLPAPKNSTGTYQLITFAPGYKESKRGLSYSDPGNTAVSKGTQDEFIIAMPLVRVKSGDYIEFSNVKFFANSTILQPESRDELGGLAALMKENQSYQVVIHGHCNGNDERDITLLGSSTDLFATSPANVRERSDAKRFTLLRAETVKAFLAQEGIDISRIKTKGDGGKNYIYPTNSTLSARNDRVEIEIKKGK